jgi:hypothetical protein
MRCLALPIIARCELRLLQIERKYGLQTIITFDVQTKARSTHLALVLRI